MTKTIEITATYQSERIRFPGDEIDTVIGVVRLPATSPDTYDSMVTIKGPAAVDELREGCDYVFFGHWSTYKNKRSGQTEKQFHFSSFVQEEPASRDAIIAYLIQHGEGHGIGRSRAAKLYEHFGADAVKICRESPERVADAMRGRLAINTDQATKLSESLTANAAIEKTKLSLASLLAGRGFIKSITHLAIQKWGVAAAQIIKRDPYKLMTFKSCGFKRCDAMYLDLKLNPARLKRQALCAWYSIARNTDGSTWFTEAHPVSYIRSAVAGTGTNAERALQLAVRGKALDVIYTRDGSLCGKEIADRRYFAEHSKSQHEQQIAQAVAYSTDENVLWPDPSEIDSIDDHQRGELLKATQTTIGILGGSPGTGKTWTVASLVELIGKWFGLEHVAIAAPTGKAAVRVTENLQGRGINITAKTLHSMLARLESSGNCYFHQKFLIIDEVSMGDTDLIAAVFRARPIGMHILLVGDVNQLPPVGHGSPLRDLIQAGVSYGELREIKRNSGGIVETCATIRDNPSRVNWNTAGSNLVFHRCYKPESQIETILSRLKQAKLDGLDPIWDCQVVVAVNERSPLSRKELNKVLQQELNPTPASVGSDSPFRVNDKIVNLKNGWFELAEKGPGCNLEIDEAETNDDNEVYVANGELAKVVSVDGNQVIAELSLPYRLIKFWIGKKPGSKEDTSADEGSSGSGSGSTEESNNGCTFDLGYALSVHKSQGSDWPRVFVVIDEYPGAKMICDRSWIYTAISRAKLMCELFGKEQVASAMCKVSNINSRKTFLRERILQLKSIEVLAGV